MTAHSRKVALFGCSLIQSIVTQIHTRYTANHRPLGEITSHGLKLVPPVIRHIYTSKGRTFYNRHRLR